MPRCALLAKSARRHSGSNIEGNHAPMSTHHFNAPDVLTKIRQHKKVCQRKSYQKSRLIKLRSELVQLRKAGASYRELTLWLRKTKRIKMTHTSVMRYLKTLTELQESNHA